jgi:hypothetical protein
VRYALETSPAYCSTASEVLIERNTTVSMMPEKKPMPNVNGSENSLLESLKSFLSFEVGAGLEQLTD